MAEYASANRISFYAAHARQPTSPAWVPPPVKKYAEFVRLADDLAQIAVLNPPQPAWKRSWIRPGTWRLCAHPGHSGRIARGEPLELLDAMVEFETENPGADLEQFLEHVALVADADSIPNRPASAEGENASAAQIAAEAAEAKAQGMVTLADPAPPGPGFPVVFLTGMGTACSRISVP